MTNEPCYVTKQHSILPPSSAARRVQCPGSRQLESLVPQAENESAMEGTAAHIYLEYLLNSKLDELLKDHPNTIFTDEMKECAQTFNKIIQNETRRDHTSYYIECKINIPSLHPECFGTPDIVIFDHCSKELIIYDYKYGHRPVEVYENYQLLEYAIGRLDGARAGAIEKITLAIYQPRSFHSEGTLRKWTFPVERLKKYLDILKETETLAMSENPPIRTGAECTFCRAKHICPALQKEALTAVELSYQTNAINLTPKELSSELSTLEKYSKLLDARILGLQEQAVAEIKNGVKIPHYKLDNGRGLEKWIVDKNQVLDIGDMCGVNLRKPQDVVTPRQAVMAGMPSDMIKDISERTPGALRLVKENEKQIKKLFEGVEE